MEGPFALQSDADISKELHGRADVLKNMIHDDRVEGLPGR
jgi:hypothetical protein